MEGVTFLDKYILFTRNHKVLGTLLLRVVCLGRVVYGAMVLSHQTIVQKCGFGREYDSNHVMQ